LRRVTQVVVACLGLAPGPALAWDWSLSSTMSQTFELNDNQFMRNMLAGGTLGSYTDVTANAVALTPTSKLTIDGDVGYTKYWGPGTEGIAQTESDRVGIVAHYVTWGKNQDDTDFLDGSFHRSSTLEAVLGDLGLLTNVHGDIDQTMLGGGIQRSVSALDTIAFSANSTLTTYDPSSSGTQFTDSSAVATWRHKVDPLTTLSVNSQIEWLNYESVPVANLMLLRETAGFETALSAVLSYGANVGVVYTDAQIGSSPILASTALLGPAFASGSAVGFVGDAHAIYRITKNTTLNLLASQTVAPSITGVLTKRTTIHGGVTQAINPWSSVSLAGDVSRQTSFGTTNDFFSGSVSYSYQLAREWNTSLTYRYLHRTATTGGALLDPITGLLTGTTGPASSNSLMVTVAKTTTIIPLAQ
jgi:hypothetical protein